MGYVAVLSTIHHSQHPAEIYNLQQASFVSFAENVNQKSWPLTNSEFLALILQAWPVCELS